jgi:hypothetical protein
VDTWRRLQVFRVIVERHYPSNANSEIGCPAPQNRRITRFLRLTTAKKGRNRHRWGPMGVERTGLRGECESVRANARTTGHVMRAVSSGGAASRVPSGSTNVAMKHPRSCACRTRAINRINNATPSAAATSSELVDVVAVSASGMCLPQNGHMPRAVLFSAQRGQHPS